jgi:catechol 2,3-dioxygenase-like lactoylglutathione lyase family enzyme
MAFVAYSVRDVPKAIAFYRDVIGLTPGETFGDHWAEFNVGGIAFGIGNGEPLGITPGSSFAATFEVDDVAAERERLVKAGVTVTDVHEAPAAGARSSPTPRATSSGYTSERRSAKLSCVELEGPRIRLP